MVGIDALLGVLPVFVTPFTEDEELDLETLSRELRWIASQNVDGVVMGTVSETLHLSCEERYLVARVVCDIAVEHDLASVISVGAESASAAVEFAQKAEEAGATALMAAPPFEIMLTDGELEDYYRAIIDRTNVPLVVQDASGYSGRSLPIGLQVKLLDEYGPRIMFKSDATPIGPRLTALLEATARKARIFEGTNGIALVDSYRRGIIGTMPRADLCWAIVVLWQMLECEDFDSANDIARALASLITVESSFDALVGIPKYLLKKQGVLVNTVVRGPASFQLDAKTRDEVDRLYGQLCSKVDNA